MKTLEQHLHEQPLAVLRAIARQQGLLVEMSEKEAGIAALVTQMLDRDHLLQVWNELSPREKAALSFLVAEANQAPVATFQRRFGELRRFGPGRLQQEQPWETPNDAAEQLWYKGLITRGFLDTPDGLAECIGIPTDLLPLLPVAVAEKGFILPQAENEAPAVIRQENERLLDDLATLLIYVQNERVWLNSEGQWRAKDLQALLPQLQTPPTDPDQPLSPGGRLPLLFHLANRLNFLTVDRRRQRLHASAIQPWLELSRAEQAATLFRAWCDSAEWNDLCVTPGLHCEQGNWRNDPMATRQALLHMLGQGQAGVWRRLDDFVSAVHDQQPDFQRPDGNYQTWYIRNDEGVYLKGFENWSEVEGRLIRYLWSGPLFWLGVSALDEAGARWSLTSRGAAYLEDTPISEKSESPPLIVTEDFRLLLPTGASLHDRFRVARFCLWEASWPGYRYRITQRSLRRAAAASIDSDKILDFLIRATGDKIPGNVRNALTRFQP